jgi:hypothetical protein
MVQKWTVYVELEGLYMEAVCSSKMLVFAIPINPHGVITLKANINLGSLFNK